MELNFITIYLGIPTLFIWTFAAALMATLWQLHKPQPSRRRKVLTITAITLSLLLILSGAALTLGLLVTVGITSGDFSHFFATAADEFSRIRWDLVWISPPLRVDALLTVIQLLVPLSLLISFMPIPGLAWAANRWATSKQRIASS